MSSDESHKIPTKDSLDVHYQLDDGFALCGGNKVPRVPHDRFMQLGEVLANTPPLQPRRWPWQRCGACVAMLEGDDAKKELP